MTNPPTDTRASPDYPKAADAALSARLRALIGKESVASFARRCGVAESVLRSYLREGRMPPLDKALAIAVAAGVSIDWLATGDRPRVAQEIHAVYATGGAGAAETPLLDVGLLEGVLTTVLEAQGAHASARRVAARVVDLYQQAIDRKAAGGARSDD